jgi:hypothetical protein
VPVSAAAWERRKSTVNNVTVLTRVDEAPAIPAASAAVVAIEPPSDAPAHEATELEEAFQALATSSEGEAASRRRRLLASGSMHSIGPLEFGHNFLYVTVTSQDRDHQRQYTVEILRTEDPRSLRLEALEFSQGAGRPLRPALARANEIERKPDSRVFTRDLDFGAQGCWSHLSSQASWNTTSTLTQRWRWDVSSRLLFMTCRAHARGPHL